MRYSTLVSAVFLFLTALTGPAYTQDKPVPVLELQKIHKGLAKQAQFCRNGEILMTCDSSEVILWHFESGLRIRAWRQKGILSAQVSPDSERLLISAGKNAFLYNLATGMLIAELKNHTELISSAKFVLGGSRILTTSADDSAGLWDGKSGHLIKLIPHGDIPEVLLDARISSDGGTILTVGAELQEEMGKPAWKQEWRCWVWSASTGEKLKTHTGPGFPSILSGKGEFLASAGAGEVSIFSMETGNKVGAASMPVETRAVSWFPDDSRLVIGSKDGTQIISQKGDVHRTLKHPGLLPTSVVVSADGKFVAAGPSFGSGAVWEVATGKLIRGGLPWGTPCEFSPDNKSVIVLGTFSTIAALQVKPERQVKPWGGELGFSAPMPDNLVPQFNLFGKYDDVTVGATKGDETMIKANHVVGHPETGRLAVSYDLGGGLLMLDALTGRGRFLLSEQSVRALHPPEFSQDGKRLLMIGKNRKPVVLDLTTGQEAFTIGIDATAAHFSKDEKEVLAYSESSPQAAIWNLEGSKKTLLQGHSRGITGASWLKDGRVLTVSQDDTAKVWSREGAELKSWKIWDSTPGYALDFKRNVLALLVQEKGRCRFEIYNLDTYAMITKIDAAGPLWRRMRFSEDGSKLYAGAYDDDQMFIEAYVFEISTGTGELSPTYDWAPSTLVNATTSATVDASGGILLKDIQSGTLLGTILIGPSLHPQWSLVSADGHFDAADLENIVGIHWVLPASPFKPVPVEAFLRDYYEPHLYSKLISRSELSKVPPIADIDARQPKLTLVGIDHHNPGTHKVVVDVQSEVPVSSLRIFRDQRLIWESEKPSISAKGDTRFSVPLRIDSSSGMTQRYSAYAFSQAGVKSATVGMDLLSHENPRAGKIYLIAVGVNQYDRPGMDLTYAVNDATTFIDTLKPLLKLNKAYSDVVSLQIISDKEGNTAAQKKTIKAVFDVLSGAVKRDELAGLPGVENIDKVNPEDLVLISWSGHGLTGSDGMFYLVPSDIPAQGSPRSSEFLERCISARELSEWMRGIDSSEIGLILDTCHSSAAIDSGGFKPGPFDSRSLGQLAYDKGVRVIAATQAADVALESRKVGHGLLTYALLVDGVQKGQAFRGKNVLSIREWFEYAGQRVPDLYGEIGRGTVSVMSGLRAIPTVPLDQIKSRQQRPSVFDFVQIERPTPFLQRETSKTESKS